MKRRFWTTIFASLGMLAAVLPSCAQEIDWPSLLRDLTSADSTLREATFERLVNKLAPKLCGEQDAAADKAEIRGLVGQFDRKEDIVRLQVSGIVYVIAQCRADSAVIFAEATPALIEHAQDPVRRIRLNSVRTLVELKPDIPDAASAFLLRTMQGRDEDLAAIAVFGVARKATPGSEAEDLISKALLQKDSSVRKRAAINALVYARVTDPLLMRRLGDVLSDLDPSVVEAALDAMSHLGAPAIEANRERLRSLAETSQNTDIAAVARQLLARDTGAH
jgi:HEAT repeat protein